MVDGSTVTEKADRGGDAAFLELHAEREALERRLSLAKHRQRFCSNPAAVEEAGTEERSLLASLDRVMTQIRAAEYRRRPGARRW